MSGQIFIKLFGSNYFVMGNVRYFFWYRGTVKIFWGPKGAISREMFGTAALSYLAPRNQGLVTWKLVCPTSSTVTTNTQVNILRHL